MNDAGIAREAAVVRAALDLLPPTAWGIGDNPWVALARMEVLARGYDRGYADGREGRKYDDCCWIGDPCPIHRPEPKK